MKKILCKLFLIPAIFISVANAATESYTIDPNHSSVLWHVNHFGFSSPSGKWLAEGTLILDEAKPQDSKVSITIPIAKLDTGIPKFDEHLTSADFLDAAKFPTATFESTRVVVNGKKAKVTGTLTLHGVSKPITLNVVLNRLDISPITRKKTAGFTASTRFKRSDFGITKYVPGVADDVIIDIEAEAYKDDANTETNKEVKS